MGIDMQVSHTAKQVSDALELVLQDAGNQLDPLRDQRVLFTAEPSL